ncbi:MAG: recombination-associated protein RdgC [Comamonadaceae bacterium]|nr:recombination-associated protein RdgC [Comamonadaceae bacterium]
MFKNLTIYRIGPGWQPDAGRLEQALATEPFAECSATQQKATGWVPPRGQAHGAFLEVVDGQWIMKFMIETKSVPAEAVRRKVEEQAAAIEATQGRKPGKKELRDMKDDALAALLPQAFARRSAVLAWIDPEARLLVLDAGGQGKADEVTTSLIRVAGGGAGALQLALLQTQVTPQAAMARWLAAEDADEVPEAFGIERECELKGSGEQPAVVRFARHPLETPEVRQHIAEGKLPTRLALSWQERVGFVLTQALQLKKLGFMEGVFDDADTPQNRDERFDADVALFTGELARLLPDLVEALGGEMAEPGAMLTTAAAPPEPPSAQPVPAVPLTDTSDDLGPPF